MIPLDRILCRLCFHSRTETSKERDTEIGRERKREKETPEAADVLVKEARTQLTHPIDGTRKREKEGRHRGRERASECVCECMCTRESERERELPVAAEVLVEEAGTGQPHPVAVVHRIVSVYQQLVKYLMFICIYMHIFMYIYTHIYLHIRTGQPHPFAVVECIVGIYEQLVKYLIHILVNTYIFMHILHLRMYVCMYIYKEEQGNHIQLPLMSA